MRTRLLAVAALVSAGALTIQAQQPRPTPQRPPTGDATQRANTAAADQTITVTGCVKAGTDVAGRRPNAADRGGVTGAYILTSVKMAPASTTSGIGLAPTYQIAGVADAELQKHLNHHVEVTGTLTKGNAMGNRGTAPATNPGAGRREGTPQASANADLPQLTATSVKMIAATCPAP